MRCPVNRIVSALILALPLPGVLVCLAQGPPAGAGADDAQERAMPATGAPSGYMILAWGGVGRTLFALKANTRSAKTGVVAALRDLGQVFDAKPAVTGDGFGDAEDKQCGGSFTARLKGQAIKGFVACGVGPEGAAVTVVYDRADAPASELATLVAAASGPPRQWVVHPLAGGSGTLKLPADWKVIQSTPIGGVLAEGPAGQRIGLGLGAEVVSPSSPFAAQMRAAGSMLVAPFSEPATAFKTLVPQLSAMAQRSGDLPFYLKSILSVSNAPAQLPNGRAAWIECAYVRGRGNGAVEYREKALLECYPLGPMAWAFSTSYATAPERIYDRDLPLMKEIAQSWRLNNEAIRDNTRSMMNAQNQRVAAFEDSMRQVNQAFEGFRQSMRNSELAREKSNADFDEVIRGYRTVEDTQTGDRTDVNLGCSKQVVDRLNERAGFQRYKEIPLRDQ